MAVGRFSTIFKGTTIYFLQNSFNSFSTQTTQLFILQTTSCRTVLANFLLKTHIGLFDQLDSHWKSLINIASLESLKIFKKYCQFQRIQNRSSKLRIQNHWPPLIQNQWTIQSWSCLGRNHLYTVIQNHWTIELLNHWTIESLLIKIYSTILPIQNH